MNDKQMDLTTRKVVAEPGDGFERQPADMGAAVHAATSDAVALYHEKSYTIPELAELINKSVTVVRRYISAGRFPNHYKDGPFESSKIRIPQRDVDAYMAERVQSQPAAVTTDGAE